MNPDARSHEGRPAGRRSLIDQFRNTAAIAAALLLSGLPVAASSTTQIPDRLPGAGHEASPAQPDSGGVPDFRPGWPDTSGTEFQPGDWDSVNAAFDQLSASDHRAGVTPEFGVRYSKVEGLHLEAGASRPFPSLRLSHLEGRIGYDLKRKRPTALGRLRVDLLEDLLALTAEAHSEARPFGLHDPYGNTILTLLDGYDARQYLLERGGRVGLALGFSGQNEVSLGWIRARQDRLAPKTRWHLFGPDRWMRENVPADHVVENGIVAGLQIRPELADETEVHGFVLDAEAADFGGAVLKGTREYSRSLADLWYSKPLRGGSVWQIHGSAGLVTGRAPVQALLDLGGTAGLRGFAPRGIGMKRPAGAQPSEPGLRDSLVGPMRVFGRIEYQQRMDVLNKSRIPVVKDLRLALVPFVESGSVWGARPILKSSDLRAPARAQVHWDLGFGVRSNVGYAGFLSFAEVNFAWPMGQDRGPVRITAALSSNGVDTTNRPRMRP